MQVSVDRYPVDIMSSKMSVISVSPTLASQLRSNTAAYLTSTSTTSKEVKSLRSIVAQVFTTLMSLIASVF